MTDQLLQLREHLRTLPGDSIFIAAVRAGAVDDLSSVIEMIDSQLRDNRTLVIDIVGETTVTLIEQL